MDMEKWKFKKSNGKWKTKAQAIFLNPFTIWSSRKWKFVVCPFVRLLKRNKQKLSVCKWTIRTCPFMPVLYKNTRHRKIRPVFLCKTVISQDPPGDCRWWNGLYADPMLNRSPYHIWRADRRSIGNVRKIGGTRGSHIKRKIPGARHPGNMETMIPWCVILSVTVIVTIVLHFYPYTEFS
jgi:hypothetical protein